MTGDSIKLKVETPKDDTNVSCNLSGNVEGLVKVREDDQSSFWKIEYLIPDNVQDGTHNIAFTEQTTYGDNKDTTREIKDNIQ